MLPISFKGNTRFNVLYFSDVHANTSHLKHFKTAVDEFDRRNEGKKNLKLCGGDIGMDSSLNPNMFVLKFMKKIGLDATCMGNHDLEGGDFWTQAVARVKPNFKILAANLNFAKPNEMQEKLAKHTIIERQGEKVGVIGISPLDFGDVTFIAPHNDYINVDNFNKTAKAVKQEVKELEAKGINKIFLLSHTGKESSKKYQYYENLAKIGGIDVIIGGHDHAEFDAWYKSNRNEPVKVVSVGGALGKDIVGENLDTFGVLRTVFDDKGVLVKHKCRNHVEYTNSYPISKEIVDMEEKDLEANKIIAHSSKDLKSRRKFWEEHPTSSLAADAMLWFVNKQTAGKKAQIAFLNAGSTREDISKGDITKGLVRQVAPYTYCLIKTTLTKKQILGALNRGIKSTDVIKPSLGLLQVAGMKYTVGANNTVKDVYLTNKDGSVIERIDNKPENTKYTVVYDQYLLTGNLGITEFTKDLKDPSVENIPYDRQTALFNYLENNFKNKPVKVLTGRINKETINARKEKELTIV